jgi:hypothetical protein
MKWIIGEIHPIYGEVLAMGIREGEPYRMFTKDGVVSLIPLDCLCDNSELKRGKTSSRIIKR